MGICHTSATSWRRGSWRSSWRRSTVSVGHSIGDSWLCHCWAGWHGASGGGCVEGADDLVSLFPGCDVCRACGSCCRPGCGLFVRHTTEAFVHQPSCLCDCSSEGCLSCSDSGGGTRNIGLSCCECSGGSSTSSLDRDVDSIILDETLNQSAGVQQSLHFIEAHCRDSDIGGASSCLGGLCGDYVGLGSHQCGLGGGESGLSGSHSSLAFSSAARSGVNGVQGRLHGCNRGRDVALGLGCE